MGSVHPESIKKDEKKLEKLEVYLVFMSFKSRLSLIRFENPVILISTNH